MIKYVLVLIVTWLVSELMLFFIIISEKKNIPWLLTDSDKEPVFDLNKIR